MELETSIASLKGTKGAARKQLMAAIAARPDFVEELKTFLNGKNIALRATLGKIIASHATQWPVAQRAEIFHLVAPTSKRLEGAVPALLASLPADQVEAALSRPELDVDRMLLKLLAKTPNVPFRLVHVLAQRPSFSGDYVAKDILTVVDECGMVPDGIPWHIVREVHLTGGTWKEVETPRFPSFYASGRGSWEDEDPLGEFGHPGGATWAIYSALRCRDNDSGYDFIRASENFDVKVGRTRRLLAVIGERNQMMDCLDLSDTRIGIVPTIYRIDHDGSDPGEFCNLLQWLQRTGRYVEGRSSVFY